MFNRKSTITKINYVTLAVTLLFFLTHVLIETTIQKPKESGFSLLQFPDIDAMGLYLRNKWCTVAKTHL